MQIYLDNNSSGQQTWEISREFSAEIYQIEEAREKIAFSLGAQSEEIIFTSSGSKSNRMAIFSFIRANPHKKHIIATSIEHSSIYRLLETLERRGFEITWLEVEEDGSLDLERLKKSLRRDTLAVLITYADPETGIVLPVNKVARLVKSNSDAFIYSDAAIAFGKVPLKVEEMGIDALGISGHKIHAPKGIGALYVRRFLTKFFKNASNFPLAKISAFGRAAELSAEPSQMIKMGRMRDMLEKLVKGKIPNARILFEKAMRLPNTSLICFPMMNGEVLLSGLAEYGIVASTSSVCHLKGHKPKPSLLAMNIPYSDLMGSLRFSLSRYNTELEIAFVSEKLAELVKKQKIICG